jgi:hypothetical protein
MQTVDPAAEANQTKNSKDEKAIDDPSTLATKRPKTLPMILETVCQRFSWRVPLSCKEPFTIAMIDAQCC